MNWEFAGWYGGGAYPMVLPDPMITGRTFLLSDVAVSSVRWSDYAPGRIYITEDGGTNWTDITANLPNGSGAAAVTFSPDGNYLYISPYNGSVYRINLNQSSSDTTPPTAPTNLSASIVNSTNVALSWNSSTDNVAVTGYKVYRDSVEIGTVTTTSYTDVATTIGATYTYTVKAFDAAGNYSASSNSATITIPTPSLQIVSTSVTNITTSSAVINWTTNYSSTGFVKYGTSATNLSLTSSNAPMGLNHSVPLSGLSRRTVYYYQIYATSMSNGSTNSSVKSFKTSSGRG